MDQRSYHDLLDELEEGVYFLDQDRRITFWNHAAKRITGFNAQEVLGCRCSEDILEHIDEKGRNLCQTDCPALAALTDGKVHEVSVFLHHRQGHRVAVRVKALPIFDENGETTGAMEIFEAVTPRQVLAARVQELEALAMLDSLTGLGNRRYLETTAAARMEAMKRYGAPLGILFLDLDNFKSVNDRFGHDIGDRVLRMVGQTLSANARASDIPGRWGGEEFVVLAEHVALPQLALIAERYRALIEASALRHGEHVLRTTASVGATIVREVETAQDAVRRADRLMYRSKQAGRNRVTAD